MSNQFPEKFSVRTARLIGVLSAYFLISGCATTAHTQRDAKALLQQKSASTDAPHSTLTQYSKALDKFGTLLEVYRQSGKTLYVQTRNISDATGLSHPLVGSELPHDITEMMRSAINRIGDRVVYVPFQPEYVLAHAQQGANLSLTLPDVLITGAITQFDRALASAGRANDADVTFGSGRGETDAAFERKATSTLSDLTLDLNLVDFTKQVMLPKMQAANTIRVLNETFEQSFDFAIYGSGFGVYGSTKYLQGRHGALRLLVELSVLELLGRYTATPYWRCVPNGKADVVVLKTLEKRYLAQDQATKVKWLKDTLNDYGFGLKENSALDDKTKRALDEIIAKFGFPRSQDYLDAQLFVNLYVNIPLQRPKLVTGQRS